ncbi:MAG: N-acetylmuramic acid 6-phosphate etherase, partial [Planctomycetota bacterium]
MNPNPEHHQVADRSVILTEQRNPQTAGLHAQSVSEIVQLMANVDRAVLDALEAAGPALTALIEDAEPLFNRGGRLIYLGAGTSGRLGVLDASEAPPTFLVDPGRVIGVIAGGDIALRKSSEGLEDDPDGAREALTRLHLTDDDTVIGIAAGGTTPYPLGAMLIAREIAPGCLRGFISCSPIEKPPAVDHLVVLETGPEVLTGSTRMKAGTATKLALNTISTTLMIRSGRVYDNLMVDVRATNNKLCDRAARIIVELTGLDRNEAFDLLKRAGGHVKTAVTMQRLNLD